MKLRKSMGRRWAYDMKISIKLWQSLDFVWTDTPESSCNANAANWVVDMSRFGLILRSVQMFVLVKEKISIESMSIAILFIKRIARSLSLYSFVDAREFCERWNVTIMM